MNVIKDHSCVLGVFESISYQKTSSSAPPISLSTAPVPCPKDAVLAAREQKDVDQTGWLHVVYVQPVPEAGSPGTGLCKFV